MTDSTNSPPQPARKRRRPAVVCAECRRRKIACDRKSPCGQCALHNVECIYVTGSVAPAYGRPLRPQLALNSGRASGAGDGAVSSNANAHAATNPAGTTSHNSTAGGPAASGSPLDDDDVDAAADAGLRHTIVSLGERSSRFGGRLAKTRLFGRSHWMNNMDEFKDVHSLTHLVHFVSGSVIYKSMRTCKRIARIIKAEEMRRVADVPRNADGAEDKDAWFKVPPRAVADRLVELYFNVFEPQFRILHMPTFRREYEAYMDGQATATAKGHNPAGRGVGDERRAKECRASIPAHELFMTKLVLVLALGSCFYDDVDDPAAAVAMHDGLRVAAARAVTQRKNNMDIVYCTPLDKHRLNLDTLQIYCLVTVARQTAALALGDDLSWFTTGGLLHTAFGMGLNRDPSQFKSLSFAQAEMRRRLWATILELVVQSSLDQGMPPLISIDDYDCAPPLNLNDDDFGVDPGPGPGDPFSKNPGNSMNVNIPIHYHPKEHSDDDNARFCLGAAAAAAPKPSSSRNHNSTNSTISKGRPDTEFTHTSMQRLLYRSLPTRLKIAKALNGLGTGLTYERALQLSQELLEACRYTAPVLRSAPLNSSIGGSGLGLGLGQGREIPEAERAAFAKLRIAFYEMLTRRFHHSLHSPFARKAGNNVQFYFSRRARVETVLRLLSFFRSPSLSGAGDFSTPVPSDAPVAPVAQHPSGTPASLLQPTAAEDPCRRLWLVGRGLLKCTMVDIKATAVIEMIHQLQEDHFVPGTDLTLSQRELYDTVRTIISLTHARIEAGETNVKGYLFFRAALAQVDALMTGKPVRQMIVEAAQSASESTISTLSGIAARRGIVLPDSVYDEGGDVQRDADPHGHGEDAPTISPVVLQTDELGAAMAAGTSAFACAGPRPSNSNGLPASMPRFQSSNSFSSLMGGNNNNNSNNNASTPSQILGMAGMDGGSDGPGMGALAMCGDAAMANAGHGYSQTDADSAIHLSSAATTELSSGTGSMGADMEDGGQGWADEWMMDPQSEFGLDNWFFPYNDRISGS